MIELRKHLYESLLDDEEDLIDRVDSDIYNDILNDLAGDLYKDYHINGIIREPAKLIDNHIIEFDGGARGLYIGQQGNNKSYKPITDYIPDVDTIKYDSTIYIYPTKNVSKETICETIEANKIYITTKDANVVENINLLNTGYTYVHFESIFDPVILKNVNFGGKKNGSDFRGVIHFWGDNLPIFKNVTVPKNTSINIYNTSLGFDNTRDMDGAINNILDPTYKCTVYDNNKHQEVLRKTDLKTIQATINNAKRYYLKTDLFHFKSGVKMSNFIPNLPKNISIVRIENNKICLQFTNMKGHEKTENLYCEYTDDGWRLEIYPK